MFGNIASEQEGSGFEAAGHQGHFCVKSACVGWFLSCMPPSSHSPETCVLGELVILHQSTCEGLSVCVSAVSDWLLVQGALQPPSDPENRQIVAGISNVL